MKKIRIIATAALLVAAVSAKAQFEPGTFSIQPKAGISATWLSNMPDISFSNHVTLDKTPMAGGLIGAEAEYQLANMFSLAAGINYSFQGSAWEDYTYKDGNNKFEIKDSKVTLGYLTLPVVANIYLFKGFAIKGGVQFGYLTNANINTSVSTNDVTVNVDESMKDDCKKWDLSIPMGFSYQFKVPIVIDCRYNLGLTRVNKEKIDKDCKNNVIQLTVGYKFKL